MPVSRVFLFGNGCGTERDMGFIAHYSQGQNDKPGLLALGPGPFYGCAWDQHKGTQSEVSDKRESAILHLLPGTVMTPDALSGPGLVREGPSEAVSLPVPLTQLPTSEVVPFRLYLCRIHQDLSGIKRGLCFPPCLTGTF